MKTNQSKDISPTNSNHIPFFQKESRDFLGKSDDPFFNTSSIRAKLTVSQPNDPYEKEADAMSDKLINRFGNLPFSNPANNSLHFFNGPGQLIQQKCLECEKEEKLQKKSDAASTQTALASTADSLRSSKASGNPLPHSIRQQMESSFGTDFSHVRVHNDHSAAQMNEDLQAQAFTHGNHIYFNSDKYDTNNKSGQQLLAHELTHVVQQSSSDIQRFGEGEHYKIGHQGTKDDKGNERMVKLAEDYTLSYGEMVAMAGDHFSSIEQMRNFANNSSRIGKETREELEYVRIVDIRGEKHRKDEFSEEAQKNADERYYGLAANNESHFPNPKVGDKELPTSAKAEQWTKNMKQIPNANAGYRMHHIQAIMEAYTDGSINKEIDFALATDAFGAHYLTDAFAAGHVMTARASIPEHWNKIVPLFYNNLKGYMAEKISEKLEKSMYWGILSEEAVYKGMLGFEGAYETVSKMLDTYPKLTFGDIVALSIHDYYNKKGIKAKVGGKEVKLFGDGHLDEGDERILAVQAVRLSYLDIQAAYRMGKSKSNMLDLFSLIKDGLFPSEKLIPEAINEADLPADEKPIKWDYLDYNTLLDDPKFQEALKVFAQAKAQEMVGIAKKLNDAEKEKAFNEAISTPMADRPMTIVKEIIEWTPDTGGGFLGHNEDDNAVDYTDEVEKEGALDKLVTPQRVRLIRQLASGVWAAGDEEEKIVRIFETAPSSERRKMYESIEGHKWNGNFVEGWWVDDDDLWNAIDDDARLKRLRDSINE